MTLPAQTTPTPAATVAATEPADGLGLDLKSSRQLAAAGIDVDDYKAKYDGLVGSTKQLSERFNAKLAEKESEIDRLNAQVVDLQKQLKDSKTVADSVPGLQTELETAKANHSKAEAESKKQGVLLKYPQLLAPTADGKPSPLLDVLMASNLPLDQFEAKAAELASLDWGATNRSRDGGTPPPVPPVGLDSAEGARQKALEAHDRYIKSGRKDQQAKADEEAAWKEHRRLSNK